MGTLQATTKAYRQRIIAREAQASDAIAKLYQATWEHASARISALLDTMQAALDAGEEIKLSWLYEEGRLEKLLNFIGKQESIFGGQSRAIVGQLQHDAIDLGNRLAQAQLEGLVPNGVTWTFGRPSAAALTDLYSALQPGSPLHDLFDEFGGQAADIAKQTLFSGVALGDAPQQIARNLAKSMQMPLDRALTISRTEALRAYRSAATENYRANADVLDGWIWVCDESARTCFPAGTNIQVRNSVKRIEDVKIGDEVLSHSGQYRRVYETMHRQYAGVLVTIQSKDQMVTATSNHPFLVERQGQLNWVEAGQLVLGDHVVCQCDCTSHVINHSGIDSFVERGIWQPDDTITQGLQDQCLTGILPSSFGGVMPVNTVNFQDGIGGWQEEVNRISPTRQNVFLQIFNTQGFQAKTRCFFRSCLARIFAIATNRTKLLQSSHHRYKPTYFATLQALHDVGRAATFLRAKLPIGMSSEYFATSLAGHSDVSCMRDPIAAIAFNRAKFPTGVTWNCRELLPTRHTGKLWSRVKLAAFQRAVGSRVMIGRIKCLAASFADMLHFRMCHFASCGMGMYRLPKRVTCARTEPSVSPFDPSIRDGECRAALIANTFHIQIIAKLAYHIQETGPVYNLEVEEDHSYVANGFVVHNCIACIEMSGTVHSVDESMDSHVNCRCTQAPLTKSWADILGPLGTDTSDIPDTTVNIPSGDDWFNSQDEATQRDILGTAKYNAWQQGDLSLSDLVGHSDDPEWGGSIYEKSLKELGLDASDYSD